MAKKKLKPWKYVLIGVGGTIAVLVFLVIALASISSSETLIDETNLILEGDLLYFVFDAEEYDVINVDFEVVEGSEVNLILMEAYGFADYMDNDSVSFDYIGAGSSFHVMAKSYEFEMPKSGSYYIVMDNSGSVFGGAQPYGNVSAYLKVTRRY